MMSLSSHVYFTFCDINKSFCTGICPVPEIYAKFRVGGRKGKTGATDFTRGKCQFKRPCTVGWKSQNQPVSRNKGNRTPL